MQFISAVILSEREVRAEGVLCLRTALGDKEVLRLRSRGTPAHLAQDDSSPEMLDDGKCRDNVFRVLRVLRASVVSPS